MHIMASDNENGSSVVSSKIKCDFAPSTRPLKVVTAQKDPEGAGIVYGVMFETRRVHEVDEVTAKSKFPKLVVEFYEGGVASGTPPTVSRASSIERDSPQPSPRRSASPQPSPRRSAEAELATPVKTYTDSDPAPPTYPNSSEEVNSDLAENFGQQCGMQPSYSSPHYRYESCALEYGPYDCQHQQSDSHNESHEDDYE